MTANVSQDQVAAFRLRRHHLVDRAPRRRLERVVSEVGGIQAQVPSAARLSLWNRVRDLKPEDVDHALWDSRTLVKTWCMRDTLHLLAGDEYPLYREGVMRSRVARSERWFSKRGRDWPPALQPLLPEELRRVSTMIGEVVSEGPLTRREIMERVSPRLAPKLHPWLEEGWGALVKHPCYLGKLCHGPDRGQKVSFVRPDTWLPKLRHVSRRKAEDTLLQQYLRAYGPATLRDFAHWAGASVRATAPIWDRLENRFHTVSVEGSEAVVLENDLDLLEKGLADGPPCVRLLPRYDTYILGHKDKSHLVERENYKSVFQSLARIAAVLLVNGRIWGTWSYQRGANRVTLTVEPFREVAPEAWEGLEAEAVAMERFFGAPCELALGGPGH